MIWIFALGIIGFCIASRGFRKVIFWVGGIALGTAALYLIEIMVHHQQI